jgi:hypothetical protein
VKKIDKKELKNKRQTKTDVYIDVKPKADTTVLNNGILSPTSGITEQKVNALFEKRLGKKKKSCAMTAMESVSLHRKAKQSGIPYKTLEEVFYRGVDAWEAGDNKTPQQFAFDRVNSFIGGGKAFRQDDADLQESVMLSESYAPTAQELGIAFEAGFAHHPSVVEEMKERKEKEEREEEEGSELSFEDVANLVKILKKVGKSK